MEKLKVLDLFSGIGGFSLGLERTGGFETVAFCEIDPFCQKVLKKHWPNVPIFEDVRTLNYDGSIDVITGGFPCQDISCAGKKAGISSETRSGLWSEIVRLTSNLRPKFIIVENVSNLLIGPANARGRWFGRILGDLAAIGYNAEWHCIPASRLGAPHARERIWVIAYPIKGLREGVRISDFINVEKLENRWEADEVLPLVQCIRDDIQTNSRSLRGDDGFPQNAHRVAALGNAVVPQIPEIIGHAILKTLQSGASNEA